MNRLDFMMRVLVENAFKLYPKAHIIYNQDYKCYQMVSVIEKKDITLLNFSLDNISNTVIKKLVMNGYIIWDSSYNIYKWRFSEITFDG